AAAVVAQVPPSDELAIGVDPEPVAAPPEELVDLLGADPVVLVVVEDRQQHEEVLQQVAEPARSRERHIEVPAVPPLREGRVEGERGLRDLRAYVHAAWGAE